LIYKIIIGYKKKASTGVSESLGGFILAPSGKTFSYGTPEA
jgi:hypothetical protein